MADYYYLTCYDCREELCMGKAMMWRQNDGPASWQFEAFTPDNRSFHGHDPAPIVGRFLLLHRGHEIRVLADPFPELLDASVDSVFRDIGEDTSFEAYVNGPVEPEPYAVEERENFPTAEAERLWRKIHAPWSLESTPKDERRGFTSKDVERLERQYLTAAPLPAKSAK